MELCYFSVCMLLFIAVVRGAPTTGTQQITTNSRNGRSVGCNCECGVSNLRQSRVVGGEEAKVHEFPWIASLKMDGNFFCGASLITKKHVLTAAHCLQGLDSRKMQVVLADHDRNAADRTVIERRINNVKIHESFDVDTYNNDIAVIELDRPVEFTSALKPACLPTTTETNYTSRVGVVAGWGFLSEDKEIPSVLQKVKVPVWSRQECLKDSGYQEKRITENMFCAGYRKGKRDACQGDSGGPLQVPTENGNMEVIGVVSWGRGCGRPNLPGVYTKLTNYLGWVNEALAGECLCEPSSH